MAWALIVVESRFCGSAEWSEKQLWRGVYEKEIIETGHSR